MKSIKRYATYLILLAASVTIHADHALTGQITDVRTGNFIPARLYIQSLDTKAFFHAESASPKGSAVHYNVKRFETSLEIHTTLSAHPFESTLPSGRYEVTVVHGKEYLEQTKTIEIKDAPVHLEFKLKRFANASARHYYSGDTHTHRPVKDLPNIMLAEDLNVALPLSYWSRRAEAVPELIPNTTPPGNQLIQVDSTHVIHAMNTEYEPNNVNGQRHQLGGVFVLNHQKLLTRNGLDLEAVAREAHAQGAMLDLDKHSWPWSLMLVPIMDIDLYPLSNNHVWRTQFGFNKWTTQMIPDYMKLESDERGFTEESWVDFGHKIYYTLLNCGFRMRVTAGTASGVHPVPFGFSRVYVNLPNGFNYDDWCKGLNAGQSFVTTGPMLYAKFNGKLAGHTFGEIKKMNIIATIESAHPISRIEAVSNGKVVSVIKPANGKLETGAYTNSVDWATEVASSSWFALRCYEELPSGRTRFAHTSPVHVDIPGKPLRPDKQEVQYLINRMTQEIARNKGVLPESGVNEYRKALKIYQGLMKTAK